MFSCWPVPLFGLMSFSRLAYREGDAGDKLVFGSWNKTKIANQDNSCFMVWIVGKMLVLVVRKIGTEAKDLLQHRSPYSGKRAPCSVPEQMNFTQRVLLDNFPKFLSQKR